MAKSVDVKINYSGVGQLLKGSEVQEMLSGIAGAKTPEGYSNRIHVTEQRAIANIYPDTEEARQDNYENNTLLKMLSGLPRR